MTETYRYRMHRQHGRAPHQALAGRDLARPSELTDERVRARPSRTSEPDQRPVPARQPGHKR